MRLMEEAQKVLASALEAENGRYAELLLHDGPLRQSLIGLRQGTELAAHNSPPAASMYVITGGVDIVGAEADSLDEGDMKILTHVRHGVFAREDSVFLLTTVTGIVERESHDERKSEEQGSH
ncbi:MAG: cupin [Flaviflexus sp.]|uniref:cupin n=2 Tax=Flaviflexus sp. TaxID=1969482 RepID=UPI003F920ECF